MTTDPFALFDEWFAEARASETERPRSDGACDRRRDGQAVRAHGAAEGPWARRLRLLHQLSRAQRASSSPRIRTAALALPLEVASPPGADRRPGRARAGRTRRTPISRPARARFAARRLGVRPVAPARQPRDVRAALRGDEAAVRRAGRAAPAALGRLSRRPRAHRILERPPAPAARAPAVHARRRTAGPKGCFTHDHGEDRRRAFALTRRAPRSPASRWRSCCSSLKAWAACRPTRSRCSARSPTPRSTCRQPVDAARRADRRAAGRPRSPLRPRQGGSAGGAGPGHPDHALGDRHRVARRRAADHTAPRPQAMELGIGVSIVAIVADVRADLPTSAT